MKKEREVCMKKKFVFLFMALFGLLLVPRVEVKAETLCPDGDDFFANGKKVVITQRDDGKEGAQLKLDGGQTCNVGVINIYGGAKDEPVEKTDIVFEGGTVKNIFGGGFGQQAGVNVANITIKGGTGDFVFAGGNNGAYVADSKVLVENMSSYAIKVVGSGMSPSSDINTYTANSEIIVNNGSPIVAHAYGLARVGKAKIVINGGNPYLINGYYYVPEEEFVCSYSDNFETEIMSIGNEIKVLTSGVKAKGGAGVVSASTITKLSYRRGASIVFLPEVENFGKLIENANEIIPYIRLKVQYKETVAESLVPAGVLDKDTLNNLKTEVLSNANVNLTDVDDKFYYDSDFKKVYDYEEVANDDEEEVTLYLKALKHIFRLVYEKYENVEVEKLFEGHTISKEFLEEIFEDFLKKTGLTEDDFENMEFYLDKEMTKRVDIDPDTHKFKIGNIDDDLTLYVNLLARREAEDEEITENPDTADINLGLALGSLLIGSLGLGYTIKKRKFN